MFRAYLAAPGHSIRLLLDPTAPTEGVTQTEEKPKPETPPASVDPDKAYKDALAKVNGDNAVLARESFASAERLRAENEDLRKRLPKEGALILAPEVAKGWGDITLLGTPEEIAARLKERDTFDGQLKAHAREKLHAQAAGLHKFDPEVLGQLAGPDLVIEIKEEKRNGKDVKVAQVVTTSKDDKGADVVDRVDLDKHAEKHWAKFLPSLKLAQTNVSTPSTPSGRAIETKSTPTRTFVGRPDRKSAI